MRQRLIHLLYLFMWLLAFNKVRGQQNWQYVTDYITTNDTQTSRCHTTRKFAAEDYLNDTLRCYSDFFWNKTSAGRAAIYTVAYKEGAHWHCFDYGIPGMTLLREGFFLDSALDTPDSIVIWYYRDNQVKEKGNYLKGQKSGLWLGYNKDFTVSDSACYKNNFIIGDAFFTDYEGNKRVYNMDPEGKGCGYVKNYSPGGTLSFQGKYAANFLKDSLWQYYDEGKPWYQVLFKNGDTVQTICSSGDESKPCEAKLPQFHGGQNALRRYLGKHIKFPQSMIDANKQSKVIAEFVIDTTGRISDITILYTSDHAFSDEVKRVLTEMPAWQPGIIYGKKKKVYYKLPVSFYLTE